MFKFIFFYFKNLIRSFVLVLLYLFQRRGLALGIQFLISLATLQSHAFLAEILEAKKQMEGVILTVESLTDSVNEMEEIAGIENEYLVYQKELKELQDTLNEYEKLGLDVKDFIEFKNHSSSSLKGQVDFFKAYIKRANNLIKNFSSLMESPETVTASEQIETNRTLRALLEDSQIRELRKLRQEIAKEKILLGRRKKEQEFINEQYNYINRHSKKSGFGLFHPFKNKSDLNSENETNDKTEFKKRKKFLGVF